MKKAVLGITVAAVVLSSASLLSGCFGSSAEKVSDYDSFMAAAGKSAKIELTADIDFGGEEVTPIALKELHGNGHVIKNVKVLPGVNLRNATNTGHYISLLGEYTKVVKDVTFENITIDDDGYAKYASFVAAACNEMDNVTVKNSSLTILSGFYLGGLTCRAEFQSLLTDFEIKGSAPTNCAIVDCEIKAGSTRYAGGISPTGNISGSYAEKLTMEVEGGQYVGGLVGDGYSAENCYVTESSIYAKSYASDGLNPFYVGGLGGDFKSTAPIKNCYVKDSTIKADAPYYSKGITGVGSVSIAYAGGITGYLTNSVEYCYSINNKIEAFSTGDAFAGGLIGYTTIKSGTDNLTQCYSANNTIEADGFSIEYRGDIYGGVKRALGGLVGYAENLAVSSCYVYQNTVYENTFAIDTKNYADTYIYAGGLIGCKASGTTVSNCAVNNKKLHAWDSGDAGHVFGNLNATIPDSCYKDFTDDEWLDGTTVSNAIKLDEERWTVQAGELPTLKMD